MTRAIGAHGDQRVLVARQRHHRHGAMSPAGAAAGWVDSSHLKIRPIFRHLRNATAEEVLVKEG